MGGINNPETELLSDEIIRKIKSCDSDDKMKLLLKQININGSDKDGKTVLMLVISRDKEFIRSVQYLIENGADVSKWYVTKDSKSARGFKIRSALTYAIGIEEKKHMNSFNLIIEALKGKDKETLKDHLAIARIKYSKKPNKYNSQFLESIRGGWSTVNYQERSSSYDKRSMKQANSRDRNKIDETIDHRMKTILQTAKCEFDKLPKKKKSKGKPKKHRYKIKF